MSFPDPAAALAARDRLMAGCREMEVILLSLPEPGQPIAEKIHSIRKLGKSLRGGFALFGMGKSADVGIQAIGRLLSGSRDAVSRLKTWSHLGWKDDPEAADAIRCLLEAETRSAAIAPPPAVVDWCLARVAHARQALGTLPEEDLAAAVTDGLDHLGKKMEKRFHRAHRRGEEDFHEARKALKAWVGAARFLPADSVEIGHKLKDLGDLLGDENDLATLSAWLDDHGFTRRLVPSLWEKLHARRLALQDEAIKDMK